MLRRNRAFRTAAGVSLAALGLVILSCTMVIRAETHRSWLAFASGASRNCPQLVFEPCWVALHSIDRPIEELYRWRAADFRNTGLFDFAAVVSAWLLIGGGAGLSIPITQGQRLRAAASILGAAVVGASATLALL